MVSLVDLPLFKGQGKMFAQSASVLKKIQLIIFCWGYSGWLLFIWVTLTIDCCCCFLFWFCLRVGEMPPFLTGNGHLPVHNSTSRKRDLEKKKGIWKEDHDHKNAELDGRGKKFTQMHTHQTVHLVLPPLLWWQNVCYTYKWWIMNTSNCSNKNHLKSLKLNHAFTETPTDLIFFLLTHLSCLLNHRLLWYQSLLLDLLYHDLQLLDLLE